MCGHLPLQQRWPQRLKSGVLKTRAGMRQSKEPLSHHRVQSFRAFFSDCTASHIACPQLTPLSPNFCLLTTERSIFCSLFDSRFKRNFRFLSTQMNERTQEWGALFSFVNVSSFLPYNECLNLAKAIIVDEGKSLCFLKVHVPNSSRVLLAS